MIRKSKKTVIAFPRWRWGLLRLDKEISVISFFYVHIYFDVAYYATFYAFCYFFKFILYFWCKITLKMLILNTKVAPYAIIVA